MHGLICSPLCCPQSNLAARVFSWVRADHCARPNQTGAHPGQRCSGAASRAAQAPCLSV